MSRSAGTYDFGWRCMPCCIVKVCSELYSFWVGLFYGTCFHFFGFELRRFVVVARFYK